MALLKIRSKATGKMNEMDVPTTIDKLIDWERMPYDERPYIQDFFPELNADEREFILSGITPQEWSDMFGEDE